MPTYTTSAKVQLELPSDLPTNFISTYMTTMIADASDIVETMVGDDYAFSYESSAQKFPDITSDPATPAIIEKCARLIAAAEGYVRLKELNKLSGKDMETKLRRQAEKKLLAICDGDYVISISGANIRSTKIDHVTDNDIYPDDDEGTDPIFDADSLSSFW